MEAGSWRPDTTGPRRLCGWSVGPSAKHWRADSPSVYVEFLQQQQHPGGRVVSVLDSGGALGPEVQIAAATLSANSLRQTVHTHRASVHQAATLVAALFTVAKVTAGLAESNATYRRVYD